jgi:hypothetical protein
MAEYSAPFIIERTIRNLIYRREGKNYVRKKSCLTRSKVLYTPSIIAFTIAASVQPVLFRLMIHNDSGN